MSSGGQIALREKRPALRSLSRWQALVPGVLLLATLATTFLFGHDRGYFYRPDHPELLRGANTPHNYESSQTLSIAANLSPRDGFLLFIQQHTLPGGVQKHLLYGRFPVVNYALVKLSLLPFGDDKSAGIHAARMLMLLFFSAAAVLAFDAIRRLARDPWIALLAVTFAFSSTYCLFYNDAIDTEGSPLLFAMAVAFHGMVVFAQERRFAQLLVKTAVALLLDWHVYGLLFAFVAAGTVVELVRARGAVRALARSRYLGVGVFALLFGVAVLGFNLVNEYRVLDGERTLADLPSFDSMLRRTGARSIGTALTLDLAFFERQFHLIGLLMSMPYALASVVSASLGNAENETVAWRVFLSVGVVFTACAVVGSVALQVRRRRRGVDTRGAWLFAALCASGFCYSVALWQSTALHTQEVLAYIGVPLALYSMFGSAVRRLCGERAVPALAVVGVAVFALSSYQMRDLGHSVAAAERQRLLVRDLAAVSPITRGQGNVCVLPSWEAVETLDGSYLAVDYLLAGSNLVYGDPRRGECPVAADFMLGAKRDQDAELLTPQNQFLFLHRSFDAVASYEAQWRALVSREPLARAAFDVYVYMDRRVLRYARAPCVWEDTEGIFRLTIFPKDKTLLPAHRRPHESFLEGYRFTQEDGVMFNGKCMFSIVLPPYHIVNATTGQSNRAKADGDWGVWLPIDLPAEESGDQGGQ